MGDDVFGVSKESPRMVGGTFLLVGKKRGGKSFSAIDYVVNEILAKGGIYCGNMELREENVAKHLREKHSWVLQKGQIIYVPDEVMNPGTEEEEIITHVPELYKFCPPGTEAVHNVIVIDEAHFHFNTRNWQKNFSKFPSFWNFLRINGKKYIDVIFLTHSVNHIDKQLRELCDYAWVCINFRDTKLPLLRCRGMLPFIRQLWYDLQLPPGSEHVDEKWIPLNSSIRDCYFTREIHGHVKGVQQAKTFQGAVESEELAKEHRNQMWRLGLALFGVAFIVYMMAFRKAHFIPFIGGSSEKPPAAAPGLSPGRSLPVVKSSIVQSVSPAENHPAGKPPVSAPSRIMYADITSTLWDKMHGWRAWLRDGTVYREGQTSGVVVVEWIDPDGREIILNVGGERHWIRNKKFVPGGSSS